MFEITTKKRIPPLKTRGKNIRFLFKERRHSEIVGQNFSKRKGKTGRNNRTCPSFPSRLLTWLALPLPYSSTVDLSLNGGGGGFSFMGWVQKTAERKRERRAFFLPLPDQIPGRFFVFTCTLGRILPVSLAALPVAFTTDVLNRAANV